jgi:drug/metabolite transporter (DMT)-like permease
LADIRQADFMWLLYAFTGPLLWAISTHIDKYLVDRYFRHSDTAVLMVFTALTGLLLLPVIALFDAEVFKPALRSMAVMAGSGILYMGGMLFYLRAIQREEASVVAPLFQANTLFTYLLAWIFLRETLGWRQGFGIALVAAGALCVSVDNRLRLSGFKSGLVLLMLAASLAVALSSVLFKFFAVDDAFWPTTFWTFVGEGLFGLVLLAVPRYRKQFVRLVRRRPGAVMGINASNELINLGGGLGVRYASLLAPVALVTAVSSTTTFFVFLFGILLTLFFPRLGREDLSAANLARKGAGAVLVTLGIALVEWQRRNA